MNKFTILVLIYIFIGEAKSQTSNEVLRDGIAVKKTEKIFIEKAGSVIEYNLANTPNFKPLIDSSIFLIHKSGVNIHLQMLNPLRFSYDTSLTLIADPISEAQENAFSSIYSRLESVAPRPGAQLAPRDSAINQCQSLKEIVELIAFVSKGLENDQKRRILSVFNQLRDLDFNNKDDVKAKVATIDKDSIQIFRNHFNAINDKLDKIATEIDKFTCQRDDSLITKYVLMQIFKDLKVAFSNKKTRLDNLEKAMKIIKDVSLSNQLQGEYSPVWFADPIFVPAPDKKITILTLTINYSGMEVKEDEIVTTEKRAYIKKVLRFRKFERFVPEISTGIVHSFLAFPKYGTTKNDQGEQIVAHAGEEKFKQWNITGMVNFVYFIEDSKINPLIQIGVGENSDYPTLFTGIGGRFNTGARRLAFSFGAATSWIKTLDKLKIGDVVSGTSDIEKDLKFELKLPKLYIGIQYNF